MFPLSDTATLILPFVVGFMVSTILFRLRGRWIWVLLIALPALFVFYVARDAAADYGELPFLRAILFSMYTVATAILALGWTAVSERITRGRLSGRLSPLIPWILLLAPGTWPLALP